MRRFIVSLLAALALALASLGSALGHAHGITPLLCLSTDNAEKSGGLGTNGTAADDDNGGPITGVIPISVGNAPLVSGVDGGRNAAVCD
jgi:hypothetical protein